MGEMIMDEMTAGLAPSLTAHRCVRVSFRAAVGKVLALDGIEPCEAPHRDTGGELTPVPFGEWRASFLEPRACSDLEIGLLLLADRAQPGDRIRSELSYRWMCDRCNVQVYNLGHIDRPTLTDPSADGAPVRSSGMDLHAVAAYGCMCGYVVSSEDGDQWYDADMKPMVVPR